MSGPRPRIPDRAEGPDRGSPLTDRRAQLKDVLVDAGAAAVMVGKQTDDLEVGRAWFKQLAGVGVEGIVAKRAQQRYRPGPGPG